MHQKKQTSWTETVHYLWQYAMLFIVLTLALPQIVGCQSAPPPPPYTGPADTDSDRGMPEPVAMEHLDDLIAEATAYFARTLPNLPQISAAARQQVFAVPQTLENHTGVPDGRLRQALDAMRVRLASNEAFAANFLVISATELQANQSMTSMQSDAPAFRDPLQRNADRTVTTKYAPDAIYEMTGKFYQSTDYSSAQRSYRLFIRINHVRSRSAVLSYEFARNLQWDGHRWVVAN